MATNHEDSKFKVGDDVHAGIGAKGGAGVKGVVTGVVNHALGGRHVQIKSHSKHYNGITKKMEHKLYQAPEHLVTKIKRNPKVEENENLGEVGPVAPIAARLGTLAARTLVRAYTSQGGSSAIKGAIAGVTTAVEVVRRKLFSPQKKTTANNDYTTGGGYGTTADGKHYEFKTEGYASGREAVKKMLDANKAKAAVDKLKEKPKTYSHFTKDGTRIKVTIPESEVEEGYAGGATISHNHGNPAPDLTRDTKVSTVHRPGRSTSRPGTATPPSYGTKARDLTKNSNPTTRHKPLTAGRIKEGEEMEKDKDLRQIVEMYGSDYPVASVHNSSKESQKMRDFSHHASEYHHNKRMSKEHHKLAGDHEEEHGVTPFGEAHYHKHMFHEKMTAHHANHLAKEHGMNPQKMAHLYHKHRDSSHDFTLALAAEGKEPLKQAKPNRGKWRFKK